MDGVQKPGDYLNRNTGKLCSLEKSEVLWSSVFVTLVAKKYRFMQFELDMVFDTR